MIPDKDHVLSAVERATTDVSVWMAVNRSIDVAEDLVAEVCAIDVVDDATVPAFHRAHRAIDEVHRLALGAAATWRTARQLRLAEHAAMLYGANQVVSPWPAAPWSGLSPASPAQARLGKFGR